MATKKETKQKHPETSGELYNVNPRGVRSSSLVDIYLRIYQKNSMLKFRHKDKKIKQSESVKAISVGD